ncbi:MAG: tyrosine recombinase XerC [Oscillospiraceae bacterium]|nr:tyrosine recombinase XerC [Oscillospiraceae bacterium]
MKAKYFDTMPARAKDFLNYQSIIKNRSATTVEQYCLDLRLFFKFMFCKLNNISSALIENEDVTMDISVFDDNFYNTVTLGDAYEFLAYCRNERENKEKARARKVSSLRAFFKYLRMNGIIEDNPMINLDSPKLSKNLPKYLNVEQAKKLLSVIDGANRERDYCIVTLLLNCGMRLSELVSLDYNKITFDGDSASIIITGKGSKQRTVYLNHACVAAINAYMRVRTKDGVKDRNALFLSNRHTRISPKTVQHMVDVYLEKAGFGGMGFSVHKLRHTAATLMYQTGKVDVLALKEILGHENLNTTQIYTHLLDEQLKKAVEANPLADINSNKE